jgi:5-methylcytosine-specific restriction endonuclease McrA
MRDAHKEEEARRREMQAGLSDKQERDRRHDARRRASQPWRALYDTKRWARIRDAQLAQHPNCERCIKLGRTTPATVVHHVRAHKGVEHLFYGGPFESLCAHCHNSDAQGEEARGYSTAVGIDGFPIDPAHPANRRA